MKKLIVLLLPLLIGSGLIAQDNAQLDRMYNEYARLPGTVAFSFNKELIDAIDIDLEWKEQLNNVKGDIHELRLILFSEMDNGNSIISSLNQKLIDAGFPRIKVQPSDKDHLKFFGIYGKAENGYFNDVNLLIQDDGNRAYLLMIRGKFTISELL